MYYLGLCASDKSLIHDDWVGLGFKMMDATKGIAGAFTPFEHTPVKLTCDLSKVTKERE